MVGGQNSFGPGGYHRTLVEKILPVDMDISKKKILPKGALVIILHTCEFPEGNTWAKRITKQAIKVLGSQDEVGVIDYEAGASSGSSSCSRPPTTKTWRPRSTPPLPATCRRSRRPWRWDFDGLKDNDAAAKHMIIISDGDPQPPPPALVQEFRDDQVTMSMVAIFPHGGQEIDDHAGASPSRPAGGTTSRTTPTVSPASSSRKRRR